jgi:hypothetical protein
MKAQQLGKGGANPLAGAICPGEALVPQEVVQDGRFDGQRRRQQIIHFHRDENRQHTQLNSDPDSSH